METAHRNKLNRNYRHLLAGKRVVVLGIPDDYEYMDEELIELLRQKCFMYLPSQ